MTKNEAIDKVILVIRNRMAMMSKPTSEEAYSLCDEYGLTAKELLARVKERLWNA